MYNRVGPSELAVREQETLAATNAQNINGRRPQTQENIGARGGRRSQNYRANITMQMRNFAKVTSTIGKRINSEAGGSSSMGVDDEENKSTQGGSNYKFNSGRDFGYPGILSQTIVQHGQPIICGAPPKSASRYGGMRRNQTKNKDASNEENSAFNQSNTAATRIKHYRKRQKVKAQSGLQSTLQLKEKLSLLSYNPPGAHQDGRIRCSTRNQTYRRRTQNNGVKAFLNSQDEQEDFLSSFDDRKLHSSSRRSREQYSKNQKHVFGQRNSTNQRHSTKTSKYDASTQNRNTADITELVTGQDIQAFNYQQEQLYQHDSLCISTGEKDLQSNTNLHQQTMVQQHTRAKAYPQYNQQIISQGCNVEDQPSDSSNINIVTSRNFDNIDITSGNGNTFGTTEKNISTIEQKMSITPRGPAIKQTRGTEKKKSGSVFFAEKSSLVPTIVHEDTIHSSINDDNLHQDDDPLSQPLTQREKVEFGYFDSLQSRAYNDANQFGSIAVSDGEGYAVASNHHKSSSKSRSPLRARNRRKSSNTRARSPEEPIDNEGLRYIGHHVNSMQEHLNKKADKLYRGTVLIDRARTRDIMAAKIRATSKQSTRKLSPRQAQFKSLQQNTQHYAADLELKPLSTSRKNNEGQEMPFAITSRQKETQVDSEFHMTDELMGSSGSQLQPATATNAPWMTTSLEQNSYNQGGPSTSRDPVGIQYIMKYDDQLFQQNEEDQQIKHAKTKSKSKTRRNGKSVVQNRIYLVKSPEEQQSLNLIIGADVRSDKQQRVQRYMGEMEKRAIRINADKLRNSLEGRKKKANQTVTDIFAIIFNKLKGANKEKWAARTIQRWWKNHIIYLKQEQYKKWLPIDIDPENCDFRDVDRVLKVLDEYALQKLGVLENEPLLPQVVIIQRRIRSWLSRTRLNRCVRDGIKFNKMVKAMQRFANRAPQQHFFHQYEITYGKTIEQNLKIKHKKDDRDRRIAAGENVSDTSSMKEQKKCEKQALIQLIRKQSLKPSDNYRRDTKLQSFGKKQSAALPIEGNRELSDNSPDLFHSNGPTSPKVPLIKSNKLPRKSAPLSLQANSRRGTLKQQSKDTLLTTIPSIGQKLTRKMPFNESKNSTDMAVQQQVSNDKSININMIIKELKVPEEEDYGGEDKESQRSMAKTKIMKGSANVVSKNKTTQSISYNISRHSSTKTIINKNTVAAPQTKPQLLMMAAAPIKSRSKRTHYHSRLGSQGGPGLASPTHFGGQQVNSNETLHRVGGLNGVRSNSFKTMSQVGDVKISASPTSSAKNGLTVRTVRHFIDRDCMWYNPPHNKAEWALKGRRNKWRPDVKAEKKRLQAFVAKHGADFKFDEAGLSKKKMRQIRRKQFYAFFEGFFDKHTNDSVKLKIMKFEFTEEEKTALLAKYFKKYFNEKVDVEKTDQEEKLESEPGIHNKINKSIKPFDGKLNFIADNHRDAFLGKSKGILGAYGTKQQTDDFKDILKDRQHRKMKPAKILIQSQFVPGKPDKFGDMINDDKRSQRSFNRIDDSTLSHRLSQIPRERANTMLSSSIEGSYQQAKPPAVGNLISIMNMKRKVGGTIDSSPNRKRRGSETSRKRADSNISSPRQSRSHLAQTKYIPAVSPRGPEKGQTISGSPSCRKQPGFRQSNASIKQSQKLTVEKSKKGLTLLERQNMESATIWKLGNPQSDRAPELEKHTYKKKAEEQRVNNIQIMAQNAKVTDEFSKGFPAYQTILEKYTPSRIFAGRYGTTTASNRVQSRQTDHKLSRRTTSYVMEGSVSEQDDQENFQNWKLKGKGFINMSTL